MPLIKVFKIKFRHLVLVLVITAACCATLTQLSDMLENRYIDTLSTALAGRTIVIDPGHGGIDTGSKSNTGTNEKDITLEVSKRLAAMLGQAGAAVILTRECDMWLAEPDAPHKKRSDLSKRVEMANQNNADVFLSVHVNSFVYDRRQRGAQTFSQPGDEDSRVLSRFIQKELVRVMGNTNRKPKEIDYFIRRSKAPAVIVEIGFLSNSDEEKLLLDSAYQSKMAFAMYCGLVRYFSEKDVVKAEPAK